jgi:hypothetical protein
MRVLSPGDDTIQREPSEQDQELLVRVPDPRCTSPSKAPGEVFGSVQGSRFPCCRVAMSRAERRAEERAESVPNGVPKSAPNGVPRACLKACRERAEERAKMHGFYTRFALSCSY